MPRIATCVALVTLAGCFNDPVPPVVKLTPAISSSFEGQGLTHTLSAVLVDAFGTELPILANQATWSVAENSLLVTVDTGVVTVANLAPAGDYTVRAAVGSASGTAIVRVLPRPAGYMVFVATVNGNNQVFIKDFSTDGPAEQLTNGSGLIGGIAADASTSSIFFARGAPPSVDVFRVQFDGTGLLNLTNDAASNNAGPAIDPASHDVFFTRRSPTTTQVTRMHQDGAGLTTVTSGSQNKVNPSVSPDGQWLAWAELYQPGFNQEIVTARITGLDTVRFTNRTGIDGPGVWLTNTRVGWLQFGTPTDLFVASAPGGTDAANITSNAAVESSPGRACDDTSITFISTLDGLSDAYHLEISSGLLVKYSLGYAPTLVRRVCPA